MASRREHVDDHLQKGTFLHALEPIWVYPLQTELYAGVEPQHVYEDTGGATHD